MAHASLILGESSGSSQMELRSGIVDRQSRDDSGLFEAGSPTGELRDTGARDEALRAGSEEVVEGPTLV